MHKNPNSWSAKYNKGSASGLLISASKETAHGNTAGRPNGIQKAPAAFADGDVFDDYPTSNSNVGLGLKADINFGSSPKRVGKSESVEAGKGKQGKGIPSFTLELNLS